MKTKLMPLCALMILFSTLTWAADEKIEVSKLNCYKNSDDSVHVAEIRDGKSSLFPYAIDFLDLDGNLLESVRLSVMLGIETGTISKIIFNLKGIKEKKKIKYVKISHYLNSNNPDLSEYSGEISLIVEDLGETKSARIVKDDKTILECK